MNRSHHKQAKPSKKGRAIKKDASGQNSLKPPQPLSYREYKALHKVRGVYKSSPITPEGT